MSGIFIRVALAGFLATSTSAEDPVFRKSRIFDGQSKGHRVELSFRTFGSAQKALVVQQDRTMVAYIALDSLGQVAYSYSVRHRVNEGTQLMTAACSGLPCLVTVPAGMLAGAAVMTTKSKNHWLYLDYNDVTGSKELVLQLDKSEYRAVLAALKAQTGKDVEILPEDEIEQK